MDNTNTNKNIEDTESSHLIDTISYPEDLRKLDSSQLPKVCDEIRKILISNLSSNPGHFGSSMGAVEIIVALHYVFNTPRDRIVFDVGHQAYAHKILTGRKVEFKTQRTFGGISGFPLPAESEYDTFVCGHAGNSISAALGMAIADLNTPGEEDRHTVALIGDASISGGLAFEGLNNASINPNNLLIILNDNDMSIDDNVGALHKYLSNLTTSSRYNKWRYRIYNLFRRKGLMNEKGRGSVLRFGNALKSLISRQQNIFEGLNIRYFGPFDGNDVTKIVKVLNEIKDMKGPRILHLHSIKGKGFRPAEENPGPWHAPGKFNPETGDRLISSTKEKPWQKIFGETLLRLAKTDERIVGITAAMPSGTSIDILQKEMPERVYDVGISEGHAVTFAGGLAAAGKKPFVAIYSSFLQRGFDNVIHDTAIQGLPVTFCIDRAGLVGEDGVTHHGVFDIAYMRMIPNMKVAVPSDSSTLIKMMEIAANNDGPMSIRYPRGKCIREFDNSSHEIRPGKGRVILTDNKSDIAVLTVGPVLSEAYNAIEQLKFVGINVHLYDMLWVNPLDTEMLTDIAENYKALVTIEDGSRKGGFGSAVTEFLSDKDIKIPVIRMGIPDSWIAQGSVEKLRELCGFDANGIIATIKELSVKLLSD